MHIGGEGVKTNNRAKGRAADGWTLGLGFLLAIMLAVVSACGSTRPAPPPVAEGATPEYKIAAGDTLEIHVWRAPDLSVNNVPVRPDGRISMPLVQDLPAAGKTSVQLATDIKSKLASYMQDPIVTVIVSRFSEPVTQQVRVVGEVLHPISVPWRPDMSALDAVIQTGGLTQFARGNDAVLVRKVGTGPAENYRLRLDDLIRDGDTSANVPLVPGDEIIVPRSWF